MPMSPLKRLSMLSLRQASRLLLFWLVAHLWSLDICQLLAPFLSSTMSMQWMHRKSQLKKKSESSYGGTRKRLVELVDLSWVCPLNISFVFAIIARQDKPSNSSTNVWTNLKFQGEHGSQMTDKFRKLMGIKSNDGEEESASCGNAKGADISTSQEKLFQNLDMQYSVARMSTHSHRGVGLGFSSSSNNRLI